MVVIMILVCIFTLLNIDAGSIAMVITFICVFESTSGPITWLYISEIMQDKASGLATGLNWLFACLVSAGVPYGVYYLTDTNKNLNQIGYLFLLFAILTSFGTVFILYFMKETRGKTKYEIEQVYALQPKREEIELKSDNYQKM